MNLLNPSLMKGEDRRREAASLLALGIIRLQQRRTSENNTQKTTHSLDFRVFSSVHANHKDEGRNRGIANE